MGAAFQAKGTGAAVVRGSGAARAFCSLTLHAKPRVCISASVWRWDHREKRDETFRPAPRRNGQALDSSGFLAPTDRFVGVWIPHGQ